ncbi:MAG: hypothetical protein ABWY25_06880 [Paenisporosarcina sp.]
MRTDSQPVSVSGIAGGGGDVMGPTVNGKPAWYAKYLGGSGGDWDLHFPGAKRLSVVAAQNGTPSSIVGTDQVRATSSFVRMKARNTAGAPVNATWYFNAQVWY